MTKKKTGGRKKGTPNKSTAQVKDAILQAFDEVGGANYLMAVALKDPKTFCGLLGKVLPQEVKAELDKFVLKTRGEREPKFRRNMRTLERI